MLFYLRTGKDLFRSKRICTTSEEVQEWVDFIRDLTPELNADEVTDSLFIFTINESELPQYPKIFLHSDMIKIPAEQEEYIEDKERRLKEAFFEETDLVKKQGLKDKRRELKKIPRSYHYTHFKKEV